MTSKEIVTRAIEFNNPERLPMRCPAHGYDDTYKVQWNQLGFGDLNSRESFDEWGCKWKRTEIENMGLITGHPLIEWENLDHYKFPDPDDPKFYEGIERGFEKSDGKYVYVDIFMLLFERLQSLRGFENTLTDLYIEQEKIGKLADYIIDFDIRILENVLERFPNLIDGFTYTDDWGTQLNTLISREMWCDFFKPRYQKIIKVAKKHNLHVWMHSCGKINNIIPDIIDLGVDVLNLEQPRTVGIEEISKLAAGKVCFATGCDIQNTLPMEDKEGIEEEVKLLLSQWGTSKGGIILADDENDLALGNPLWKKKFAIEKFRELDPWKKR